MKIAKKNAPVVQEVSQPVEAAKSDYSESIDYIKSAIDCLCPHAKDSVVAKEAIANLSVILLDLQ